MTNATDHIAATDHVDHEIFVHAIADARAASATIRDATSPSDEYPRFGVRYYLTRDRLSGYGVTSNRVLVGLFSLVRGRGDSLVRAAIKDGATDLDCFDGFLPGFYERHGFVKVGQEANWTEGEPDIIFMELR